jgi:uncharacterized phage-associated protein
MKKMKYCDYCLTNVNCDYKERNKKEKINGLEIEYLEKYYVCSVCGNEFYDDLLDYNVKTANEKLREKTGLITIKGIEEILDKYSIGKKPLSLVLNMGEITITRYLDGQNPTKDNSEILKNILNNPLLYEMYLIGNKDKISKVAYKKSMGKTKQVQLSSNKSKLYNISLYMLEKEKEVDPLSLQKLLYFCSGFSKTFSNTKNLINDDSESWKYGPVYREIYEAFAYYGYEKIDYNELVKDREFDLTEEEKKFIDAIIDAFGFYSGSILREMTHMTDPWIESRKGLEEDEPSYRIIDNESVEKYFKKVCEEYKISTYDDIKKYSDDMFKKAKKKLI